MASHHLLSPEQVRGQLAKRFANKRGLWLRGDGEWPLSIPLGSASERDAQQHPDAVRSWVSTWQTWQGPATLDWEDRHWRTLGVQRLPKRILLADAGQIADWLGESARWKRALLRYGRFSCQWPVLTERLCGYFDLLADYSESDFQRLGDLLYWLVTNPDSRLYPRQLPVPGVDSKWLEGRKGVIVDLLNALRGGSAEGMDFFRCCGLRPVPKLIRLRLLDTKLRRCVGGLGDVSAPVADLARLDIPVKHAFIVENLQTGLAFVDLPESIVLMGLGYGVEVLGELPWLRKAQCVYWGDLDTHGFAILNHARAFLPELRSVLMDEETLMSYKALWGEEARQHAATELPRLTKSEQSVFQGIRGQRWGVNVRLEQERICWTHAWKALCSYIEE